MAARAAPKADLAAGPGAGPGRPGRRPPGRRPLLVVVMSPSRPGRSLPAARPGPRAGGRRARPIARSAACWTNMVPFYISDLLQRRRRVCAGGLRRAAGGCGWRDLAWATWAAVTGRAWAAVTRRGGYDLL